ncbi:MAG: anaerobic ribonucleoside-triphosphate reductase activating protein [Holosporales bacterium]|jgi:anaerobic ribonucleoside-triphosphate reductase activating protein|nr:anaerobic ribonucleoside-triphosphate reductase activating protein [Holosporales bacterium]
MKIGGLLKFSVLDYPGKLSCVVFCQGCFLRCTYCHNPEFQPCEASAGVDFQEFLDFLKSRSGCLDAVVFSGGEPLLQTDLIQVIEIVKELGFFVGIHTSGVVPNMFKKVVSLVDWIGFDIKTVFRKYDIVTQFQGSGLLVKIGLEILLNSGVSYEIRTTYDSRFISQEDVLKVAEILQKLGVREWTIQECVIRDTDEALLLPDKNVVEEASKLVRVNLRHQ